jgi:hypothetical protein
MHKLLSITCLAIGLLLAGLQASHAQVTRTWVSGVGDDVNPCSRTAPCKTFAGAISKTATGGEINVLDPGGFGAVTITRSISILSASMEAGVLVSGTNGIVINAAPTDVIHLRGLDIDGIGTGLAGVRIMGAGYVDISNCLIRGFKGGNGTGILVAPTSSVVKVLVSDTNISNNAAGLTVQPGTGGYAKVMLNRVNINGNTVAGIQAFTARAEVDLSNTVVTGNLKGLLANTNSAIISFGNNVIINNPVNGAPTQTVPLQ